MSLTWLFGASVVGRVTDKNISSGEGTTYSIYYDFLHSGVTYSGKDSVSCAQYNALSVGQEVSVRVSPLWPERFSLLRAAGDWHGIAFLWLFAAFWNSCLFLFWKLLYGSILRQQHLMRHGQAAAGILTRKEIVTGSYSDTHYIHYRWHLPTGSEQEARHMVQSDEYLAAREGQSLTVLFDPKQPKHSLALEYAPYEIVR